MKKQVVTVGGEKADIRGYTSQDIQIAIDSIRDTGGTVALQEGTFEIIGPVRLADTIVLQGQGAKTVLRKCDGVKTRFVIDADYGEQQAAVEDPAGFVPGMGIQVYDAKRHGGWAVTTARVTAVKGKVIHFDEYLVRDYEADQDGIVSNACSVVEGIQVSRATVKNLVIEGNKQNNEMVNGCRGGGVYFQKARNCRVENVVVKDFAGDGFSWQISEAISVKGCRATGCTNFGCHPGSGSKRSAINNCEFDNNDSDGMFVCWRVQNGKFTHNRIHHNGRVGINIGHKDTDNLFEHNHIFQNAGHGILVRQEKELNSAHRNTYRHNTIENNGTQGTSCGICIVGFNDGTIIEKNVIQDTGKGTQVTGIKCSPQVTNITIEKNKMSGHGEADVQK